MFNAYRSYLKIQYYPVMLSEAPAKPYLYAKAGNISDLRFFASLRMTAVEY
jgi:hypothetical protein